MKILKVTNKVIRLVSKWHSGDRPKSVLQTPIKLNYVENEVFRHRVYEYPYLRQAVLFKRWLCFFIEEEESEGKSSDDDDDDDAVAFKKEASGSGSGSDSESEDDENKKKKGTEGLIDIENPNRFVWLLKVFWPGWNEHSDSKCH